MAKSSRYPRTIPRLPTGDDLYELLVVDRHLTGFCERLRVLKYITPVNAREVRDAYLGGHIPSAGPDFLYRDEDGGDFDAIKAALHKLPIRSDTELGLIFRRKRDELHDVLTMLQARGTSEFCQRSKLLYGTATREEVEAVAEWLALPPDPPEAAHYSARDACHFLRNRMSKTGLTANIRLRQALSSSAAAGETSIAVRTDASFSERELERIFVHEGETHLLRFRNGERQPFRSLFYHGFPRHGDYDGNYLITEEGLATFQEEITGLLTNDRRRLLAGRVLAVYLMDHEGLNFNAIFDALKTDHGFDADTAFSIAERTFRGGGYTKDHIYHTGYAKVRDAIFTKGVDFSLLLLGKIGIDWEPVISEMYGDGEGILNPPRFWPRWLRRVAERHGTPVPTGDVSDLDEPAPIVVKITPADLEWLRQSTLDTTSDAVTAGATPPPLRRSSKTPPRAFTAKSPSTPTPTDSPTADSADESEQSERVPQPASSPVDSNDALDRSAAPD